MREQVYVDRLFADYEDTPEIRDFKEEITANLTEHVKELVSKGLDDENAFEKAAAELGDITAIADDVGKKKRNETIVQMYMKAKVPTTRKTALGMTAASALSLLAVGIALISLFSSSQSASFFYASVVLLSFSCGMFAYFGMTQETAARYAMKSKRAAAYGAVILAGVLGAGLAVVSFFCTDLGLPAAVGIKAAFIIPAICALIFLLITEPKRHKPWYKAMIKDMIDREMEGSAVNGNSIVNIANAARFGVASGGVWMLAIAVFLSLRFVAAWQHSWLVFPFAVALQSFMVTMIFEKRK